MTIELFRFGLASPQGSSVIQRLTLYVRVPTSCPELSFSETPPSLSR
jgi:hypothetical protein